MERKLRKHTLVIVRPRKNYGKHHLCVSIVWFHGPIQDRWRCGALDGNREIDLVFIVWYRMYSKEVGSFQALVIDNVKTGREHPAPTSATIADRVSDSSIERAAPKNLIYISTRKMNGRSNKSFFPQKLFKG